MNSRNRRLAASLLPLATLLSLPSVTVAASTVDELTRSVEPQVTAWRRDIHQHPELSNREFRTSKLVAAHLKKLGLEVQTGIAHTGVVGFLKGGKPGPTIALRADMDGLPVTEKTDVQFKSKAKDTFRGEPVGVMHACGHDTHVAILMGVAQTLAALRDTLPGNVLFVFQPAEEGPPEGEQGGAKLMLQEGLFDKYKPEAVFGLHVTSQMSVGDIGYRIGPFMAAADTFHIVVKGRQAHGARPWQGVDPILTAAQIVEGIQTIVSRRVDITSTPVIVSVGAIKGGIRENIIPASAELLGTFRTFTPKHRQTVIDELKRIAQNVSAANGATAEVSIRDDNYPVTFNDPALTKRMLPTLERVAGEGHLKEMELITGAEDFSYFAQKVPGLYFFVGVTPAGQDVLAAPANHSDFFYVDEGSLPVGLKAITQVALEYLQAPR